VSDDLVLTVKQIAQNPLMAVTAPTDFALLQQVGVGGPYVSINTPNLVGSALANGGWLKLMAGFGIAWNGASLSSDGVGFTFTGDVQVPSLHSTGDIFVAGEALASQIEVTGLFDNILENSVWTVNGRKGNVILQTSDILQAGAAPISDAHFGGFNTSPTPWDFRANSDQIATTAFVQMVLEQVLCGGSVVTSFNGRGGDIVLTTADVNAAYATNDGSYPTAPTPPLYDASPRIATTAFVDESVYDMVQIMQGQILSTIALAGYAPLASPNFTGVPTAPTATAGASSGQLATTAFVHNAIVASTTGVASFNTRTGAVVLLLADVTGAGGAPLASPVFTGNPQAPTAALHDNDTSIATTAYVQGELAALPVAPVTSFNTRTGAIVLTTADVTGAGGAPTASPVLTGTPTAPTAAAATNTTQIATTAFVAAAVAAFSGGVSSFNSRTGAVSLIANDISGVGGAMLASPAFSGSPTAPTASPGTANTMLATTAFVAAAITAGAAGVSSFNTRTGAVTLSLADITGAGGAPLASPGLTGVPTAPTAAQTSNDTTVATTAYVRTALAAAPGGVSSFNSRTGAITFQASDLSAVGGALLAGPTFTGTPSAPTAGPGTSSTQLATTAFVAAAIAAGGGVNTFNGRAGTVTLTTADVVGVSGALLTVAATAPTGAAATANSALWWDTNGGQLYVNYNDGTSTQWAATSPGQAPVPATIVLEVSLAANQTTGITSGGWSQAKFDTKTTDVQSAYSVATGLFTPTVAGLYSVTAALGLWIQTTQSWLGVGIYKNGVGTNPESRTDITSAAGVGSGQTLGRSISALIYCNGTTDTISVWGFNASTSFYAAPANGGNSGMVVSLLQTGQTGPPGPVSVGSGNKVLIQTQTISTAVASVDFFNGFDGTYDELELHVALVSLSAEAQAYLRFSNDGSTFDAGTNYSYGYVHITSGNIQSSAGGAGSGVLLGPLVPALAGYNWYAIYRIHRGAASAANGRAVVTFETSTNNSVGYYHLTGGGSWALATAVAPLGVRFIPVSGNIVRGTFKLFGVVK
jgi:hypothetical protein